VADRSGSRRLLRLVISVSSQQKADIREYLISAFNFYNTILEKKVFLITVE
jgi:hypothetical protein